VERKLLDELTDVWKADENMTGKTFAVIGSNSFTGSHIVNALLDEPGNQVMGISRSPEYKALFLPYKDRKTSSDAFQFHQIDIVQHFDELVELLVELKPQVVINVAALSEVALSNEHPVEYFEINNLAVVRLCNYLRMCPWLGRYVHVSSAEIFGPCGKPANEETLFNPSTPYAVSKAATDMYLSTLLRNFDFPVTIIRSTNVYGKHQQLYKIIPRTVIYLKLGEMIELHGGGKAIKSFIHIRDVVRGILLAIKCGKSGAYHFSVPSVQTVADIVSQISTCMGYDVKSATRIVDERLGQDARYWLNCSKAERELGWEPQVPLEQGVREVIDWIESHWSAIEQEPLVYTHKV
jgi:dTDP-glucose 4,6-dehydratase